MNTTLNCPDDLIARAHAGALHALEQQRLDEHVARCAECAATLAVASAFARGQSSQSGDDAMIARMAAAAGAFAAESVVASRDNVRRGSPRPAARTRWLLVAAAVSVAMLASAAVWTVARARRAARSTARATLQSPSVSSMARPVQQRIPNAASAGDTIVAQPTPTLTANPPALVPPALAPPALVPPALAPPALAPPALATPAMATPGPAALFAAANRARRLQSDEAIALYLQLEQRFPASAEAAQAFVSLGTYHLDRGTSPAAALAQFDRYLRAHREGPLAAEALYGRATALARLGRHDDERAAWESLLARFPDSAYAARARRRVAELSP